MKKSIVVVLALLVLGGSAAAQGGAFRWWRIPRCWVVNCRTVYGVQCVNCVSRHCDDFDPVNTVTWCNGRVRVPWGREPR